MHRPNGSAEEKGGRIMENKDTNQRASISRRSFLQGTGIGVASFAALGLLGGCAPGAQGESAPAGTDQQPQAGSTDAAGELVKTWTVENAPAPIADADIVETVDADVVIVGAGTAGITAALTAVQEGASVAILQNEAVFISHGWSTGAINSKYQASIGVEYDVAEVQAHYAKLNGGKADERVLKIFMDNSGETVDWLMAETDGTVEFAGMMGEPPFAHAWVGQQTAMLEAILDKAVEGGAQVYYNTEGVQLVKEGDRVTGVIGEGDEGHILFKASKGIIMATGDYVGNREMLDFYAPDTKGLHQAILFRDGSGLCAAMGAGAQMCAPSHTKMVHGEGAPVRFEMPFLFLDRHGERFMDEGCCRMGYLNEFSKQYLAETGFEDSTATKFFSIVPSNWQDYYEQWDALAPYDISTNNAYRKVDPEKWIHGDTFEELAQAMIDYANEQPWDHDYTVESIVASIERYNELVAKGADEDFGKRPEYLTPIEAPCYAVPRGANNIDAMLDGLEVDGNYQCLDADRKPIEGLFAVGNASGPFFGNSNYPMDIEGLSVGRAITTGFATGRYVAGL